MINMTDTTKPKPFFTLHLEPMIGCDPVCLAKDAQRIADQMNVMAEYDFNGVRCIAYPGGNAEQLHTQAMAALKRMATYSGITNQVAIS